MDESSTLLICGQILGLAFRLSVADVLAAVNGAALTAGNRELLQEVLNFRQRLEELAPCGLKPEA